VFLDERDGPLPAFLLALTVLAGVVDATTILRLGHVFVATITGNLVFLGLAAAGAGGFDVGTPALAVGGFIVGAAIGGQACRAAQAHRGLALRNVLVVKLSLACAALLSRSSPAHTFLSGRWSSCCRCRSGHNLQSFDISGFPTC
jgi:uncharacterized membrane protein YoaK (UPF0700 family)